LIAANHPPATVWKYTLPQLAAFLFAARLRRRRELAELLELLWIANSGNVEAYKKKHKDLEG
jgi:hypothetical protein